MFKSFSVTSLKKFLESGSAGGILLLLCVVISLIIANSPLGPGFEQLLGTNVGYHSELLHLRYPVLHWINDGLMAVFFLMVGLEIKRELVKGELSSPKKAALPILAAFGGVAVPATIYAIFNTGTESAAGWGIPMATDIAFALAIITMLGDKVPISLKVFLAALAIVDDLIAILVIAVFYSSGLQYTNLLIAGGFFGLLLLFNRLGIHRLYFYIIPGLFIWYFIHHSGIHATIAGVLVAMTIPTKPRSVTDSTQPAVSPLEQLEHRLSVPVTFIIMPLFALVNTNIAFQKEMISGLMTPLGLGIICGLVVGKPVGIGLISWIAVKTGLCTMPDKASWKQLIGVGMLAGIGFTMSIFIALLSFAGQDLLAAEAKFSILIASLLSGLLGASVLVSLAKNKNIQPAKNVRKEESPSDNKKTNR